MRLHRRREFVELCLIISSAAVACLRALRNRGHGKKNLPASALRFVHLPDNPLVLASSPLNTLRRPEECLRHVRGQSPGSVGLRLRQLPVCSPAPPSTETGTNAGGEPAGKTQKFPLRPPPATCRE